MSYSRYFLARETKVPVPVTFGIIVVIILVLANFFGTKPTPSSASDKKVKKMSIVNPTSSQVGIFWQTEKKEIAWVIWGESPNQLEKTTFDERDVLEKKNAFLNHLVTLRDLKSNTKYYFKIISDNQLVEDSGKKPFSFTTPRQVSTNLNVSPGYGRIINTNGTPLDNAVVLINFKNAYPLFTQTKVTGEWLIPLHTIIDQNSLKNLAVDPKDRFKIEINSEEGLTTFIEAEVQSVSPIPQTVIIGKNYKFFADNNVLGTLSDQKKQETEKIGIIFPADGAVIPGVNPIIKGLALPGADVLVEIRSEKIYTFRIKADDSGLWRVVMSEGLSSGEHTVTMMTKDSKGKEIKTMRKFVIVKSGEQVLGEATLEASPTVPLPTNTPIIYNTPFVSMTETASPSAKPPVSGFDTLPLTFVSTGLVILGIGILFAF